MAVEIDLKFRDTVTHFDVAQVREIVTSTGFFNKEEIAVAVELVDERLQKGLKSDYYFIFVEMKNKTVGYTCFGPIPATKASYDLYWIAVHDKCRGMGIGKRLIQQTEAAIKKMGGSRIYIETSSREQYEPTRAFYLACNYILEATLQDFYAPDDSKCIYVKSIES